MKVIDCQCGKIIAKDYRAAARIANGEFEYYSWVCQDCGQQFLEKVKEPLII